MLNKKTNFKYLALSSIGIQLGLSVSIGTVGGHWLDEYFSTAPWILVVGMLVGTAAGVRSMVREITLWQKKYDPDDDESTN